MTNKPVKLLTLQRFYIATANPIEMVSKIEALCKEYAHNRDWELDFQVDDLESQNPAQHNGHNDAQGRLSDA